MKKLWVTTVLVCVFALPGLAQRGQRLSPSDQQKFDSYYSRWVQYRQTNNRDQVASMEKRMQDLYSRNGIPLNTPYERVASGGGGGGFNRGGFGDRDRDRDRGRGGNGYGGNQWRGRLNPGDQQRFDSYYSRWMQVRQSNRGEADSMQKRMWDVYDKNGISRNVPFSAIASQGGR